MELNTGTNPNEQHHRTLDLINIIDVVLEQKAEQNNQDRIKESEGRYSASGAGLCMRKQYYQKHNAPRDKHDKIGLRTMRLGTVYGEDVQNCVLQYFSAYENLSYKCYSEEYIYADDLYSHSKIGGHFDLLIVDENKQGYLYDFKTANSWKYKGLFGRNRSTANQTSNYELQLGTYAMILNHTKKYCDKIVQMGNIYFNKDNSNMQQLLADVNVYIEYADMYWQTLNDYENELPSIGGNCPTYEWECKKYCNYRTICDSPYIIQKKSSIENIINKGAIYAK